jgi:hypothetical protein
LEVQGGGYGISAGGYQLLVVAVSD